MRVDPLMHVICLCKISFKKKLTGFLLLPLRVLHSLSISPLFEQLSCKRRNVQFCNFRPSSVISFLLQPC